MNTKACISIFIFVNFPGIINTNSFISYDWNNDPNVWEIVVAVENTASCGYIATCTMELIVTYTPTTTGDTTQGTTPGMTGGGGGMVCYIEDLILLHIYLCM